MPTALASFWPLPLPYFNLCKIGPSTKEHFKI